MTNLKGCLLLALPLVTLLATSYAFAPLHLRINRAMRDDRLSRTKLHVDLADPDVVQSMDQARIAFFVWFFGASGAAAVARSGFPRMYKSTMYIKNLKGQGPTEGGEALGISPLCGYPEDLRIADVEAVVNNPLSVEEIVEQYPIEDSFFSARGYLLFQAFQEANADKNPLAVRAVYDTFAQSTDTSTPAVAQAKLELYRQDIRALKPDLLRSKLVGYASIVTLLSLLALADITAAGHAYHGWFPDWPGGQNFPACLFTTSESLSTIPEYWVGDLPDFKKL